MNSHVGVILEVHTYNPFKIGAPREDHFRKIYRQHSVWWRHQPHQLQQHMQRSSSVFDQSCKLCTTVVHRQMQLEINCSVCWIRHLRAKDHSCDFVWIIASSGSSGSLIRRLHHIASTSHTSVISASCYQCPDCACV